MSELQEKPKNRLASSYTKEEIDELIAKVKVCEVCHHGYWFGGWCDYCLRHKNINLIMIEELSINAVVDSKIEGIRRFKPQCFKKPMTHFKEKLRKCEVCGTEFRSNFKRVCSSLCRIRSYSVYYGPKGQIIVGMSLEEGLKKLEKQKLKCNHKSNETQHWQ